MAHLELGEGESLYYQHHAAGSAGKTLVFVNALTGNTAMWEQEIVPAAQAAGYGTLVYNFRCQAESRTAADNRPTPTQIVDDLVALCTEIKPVKPILVGLSIGGLFAAQAMLKGVDAIGLVAINTLRKPGLRLDWINQAMVHGVEAGGFRLIMELVMPMLLNPDQLAVARESTQTGEAYQPLDASDPGYKLMKESLATDWDFPWEKITVPTLLPTGAHDHVFTISDDVNELAARLPDATRVDFPDAGHMIPVERPKAFIDALLEFSNRL